MPRRWRRSLVASVRTRRDGVTDVLGVRARRLDRRRSTRTRPIVVGAIRALVPDATFVVAGTGSPRGPARTTPSLTSPAASTRRSARPSSRRAPPTDSSSIGRCSSSASITAEQVADAMRRRTRHPAARRCSPTRTRRSPSRSRGTADGRRRRAAGPERQPSLAAADRPARACGCSRRSPASRSSSGSLDPSSRSPWLRNLLIVFGSLLVEAMPFILLGATVSAAIEVLRAGVGVRAASPCSRAVCSSRRRPPRAWPSPCASAARCRWPGGSRRRGSRPSAAVTFMLAAPIVNPVVVASTFVAYRGRDTLVDHGARPPRARVPRRDGGGLGAWAAVRSGELLRRAMRRGRGARGRRGRTPVATVLRPPHRRRRVHGAVPDPRRGARGGDPDVRAAVDRRRRREPARAEPASR